MVTRFENIRYGLNNGEIQTRTIWAVYDCVGKQWTNKNPVILNNILLSALHSTILFTIGEIPTLGAYPELLKKFKAMGIDTLTGEKKGQKLFSLDLASNSRTHGRFTFSEKPIGNAYYGEDWKRIIYGSIVHTSCKKLIYKEINYIVTDDENIVDGNYLDDPIHQIHWHTGDSHAKASWDLITLMELSKEIPTDSDDPNAPLPEYPIQFRAALHPLLNPTESGKGWVGKGTLAHNSLLDTIQPSVGKKVDLVIPQSSLKGNKPPLGLYSGKILIGTVFEADERQAKGGWMLFQWFKFETLEADGIIDKMKAKCEELGAAFDSMPKLAEIFRKELQQAKEEVSNPADELLSDVEYEDTVLRIIENDVNGLLLLHPYLVYRVLQRLRKRWLNLAKSAGVRFKSLMCQPDESLAKYNVWKNGQIVAGKVFCAASLKEGEYIVFCNPMRHWGDVQIWQNKHEGLYANSNGTIACGKELAKSLGRDFDGDFIQIISVKNYPAIAAEIKNFAKPPVVKKLPKIPLQGSLQQIAINSMFDKTGIVASLLGRARAAGCELQYLTFPPNTEAGETKSQEMRIIDFLSQELQIAVDSLKSSYPNNQAGLDVVREYLDSVKIPDPDNPGLFISTKTPWLKDFKNSATYEKKPCAVDSTATDTISKLVKLVNSYWKKPNLQMVTTSYDFVKTIFSSFKKTSEDAGWPEHLQIADEQYEDASKHNKEYGADMNQAGMEQALNPDGEFYKIAVQFHKAKKPDILAKINPKTGEPYSHKSWAAAYWRACNTNKGTAGLVFNLFPDQIIEELKKKQSILIPEIILFHCNKPGMGFYFPKAQMIGKEYKVRAVMGVIEGQKYKCMEAEIDGEFKLIGAINNNYSSYVPLGQTRTMELFAYKPFTVILSPYNNVSGLICYHEYYDKNGVLKVGWLKKQTSFGNGPMGIVLWDKSLVPELNGTSCERAKFVFEKQTFTFPTSQTWKYHPKTWIPTNYPDLYDDNDE